MNIKILKSAQKHNLEENEIRQAMKNIVCSKTKRKENILTHFAVGIMANGKTCELIFFIDVEQVVVFHAMSPARKTFINEVQKTKGK